MCVCVCVCVTSQTWRTRTVQSQGDPSEGSQFRSKEVHPGTASLVWYVGTTGNRVQEISEASQVKWKTDGGASPSTIARGNQRTTPVRQATSSPGSVLAGHRQAEEGRVSPTADGRKRESSPTASRYLLRATQARTCRRVTRAGPGVRLATSPAKAEAYNTRARLGASRKSRNGDKEGNGGRSTRTMKSTMDQQGEER